MNFVEENKRDRNKNGFGKDNQQPERKPYDEGPKKYANGESSYSSEKDQKRKRERTDLEPAEEFIDDNDSEFIKNNKNYSNKTQSSR